MFHAWVLSLMVGLQPTAPWLKSYAESSAAIVEASIEAPLFAGDDGQGKTAALLVSIARSESSVRSARARRLPEGRSEVDRDMPVAGLAVRLLEN